MSETEDTERVAQLWPVGLKERIRELVGARGVTKFTLEAVEEKLARVTTPPAVQAAAAATAVLDAPAEAPETEVAVVEREPVPAPAPVAVAAVEPPEPKALLAGESRGENVDVVTSSTGASARYSSSRSAVDELMEKARKLGVKAASDLPVPPKPEVEPEPDPEPESTPAEHRTLQEELRDPVFRMTDEEADVLAEPEPQHQPVSTVVRNLDDVEVDF